MRWADWKENVRRHPREALEADLVFAVIGFVIVAVGGIGINAGFHPRGSMSTAPAPLAGTVVAVSGLIVMLLAALLAVANIVIWTSARVRRKRERQASSSDREDI